MEEAPTPEMTGGVVSEGALTVTVPPEPLVATPAPAGSEATIPLIPAAKAPGAVPPAMFKLIVAMEPDPIAF